MSATMSSIVPLTTTFVPPNYCSSINTFPVSDNTITIYTWGPTTSASECYPSGWSSKSWFSPGLCPSDYTTGFISSVVINTITETRASCCPSGFSADTSQIGLPCSWSAIDHSGVSLGPLYADAVSIRLQSTDFTSTTSSTTGYTTITSTDSATMTPFMNSVPTSASLSEDSTSNNSGLSTGTKAGIGVGVTLGVLALGAALGFFYLRRKRREIRLQDADEAAATTGPYNRPGPESVTAVSAAPDQQLAELPTPTHLRLNCLPLISTLRRERSQRNFMGLMDTNNDVSKIW